MEMDFGDDFNEDIGQNNNVIKSKNEKNNATIVPTMKYPYLQKMHRRAATELTAKQHVELHLTAINAYISVFHIKEFNEYWKNYKQYEMDKVNILGQFKQEIKTFQQSKKPFDLKQMEQLQRKSFDNRVKMIGEKSHIYDIDVLMEEAGILETIKIQADAYQYREDLKYVDMITSEMPKLQTKFTKMFPQLN